MCHMCLTCFVLDQDIIKDDKEKMTHKGLKYIMHEALKNVMHCIGKNESLRNDNGLHVCGKKF
jgi:hypothetical protein